MGKLGQILAQCWTKIQGTLFPYLEEELDPLTEKQQQLITALYTDCEMLPREIVYTYDKSERADNASKKVSLVA